MPEFMINPKLMMSVEGDLDTIRQSMGQYCQRVNSIKGSLQIEQVKPVLSKACEQMQQEQKNLEVLNEKLKEILQQYVNTETKIAGTKITSQKTSDQAAGGGKNEPWYAGWDKATVKALLDMLGKAGDLGKGAALPIAMLKMLVDQDELTPKDIGALLKGMGNSAMQIILDDPNNVDLKKFFGLDQYKTIATTSGTKWANAMKTFKDTWKGAMNPAKGTNVAGWVFSAIANGFSNYEEFGGITGRGIAETITETVIDVAKGAALTAGVAAVVAASPFVGGALATTAVVGGTVVAITAVSDFVCKKITGKPVTELVSDTILDTAEKAVDAVKPALSKACEKATGAISSAKNAICGWGEKLVFSF